MGYTFKQRQAKVEALRREMSRTAAKMAHWRCSEAFSLGFTEKDAEYLAGWLARVEGRLEASAEDLTAVINTLEAAHTEEQRQTARISYHGE